MSLHRTRKRPWEDSSGGNSDDLTLQKPKRLKLSIAHEDFPEPLDFSDEEDSLSCKGEQEGDPISINELPNEILNHIFTFLSLKERIATEQVCERWQSVAWTWPTKLILRTRLPNLSSANSLAQTNEHLTSMILSRCGLNLKKLTLDQKIPTSWQSKKTMEIVGLNCPNLREVLLLNVPLDSKCLEVFAKGCANLTFLKIGKYSDIYDEDLSIITEGFSSLKNLRVSACLNFTTGMSLRKISCNLTVLWLKNCEFLEAKALDFLTDRCDAIEDLRLTRCKNVGQSTLSKTLTHFKDTLKVLHLDRWGQRVNWSDVVLVLHRLETLSLARCEGVRDTLCRDVANHCPLIQKVMFCNTAISDIGLSYLASLQNLTYIEIQCLSLSGEGIKQLASKGRLRRVYACYITGLENADECFSHLVQHSPHLQVLDVTGIKAVSNNLVFSIHNAVNQGTMKGVIKLGAKNTSITEDIPSCSRLKVLVKDVSCLYVDDNDFELEGEYERMEGIVFNVDDSLYHRAVLRNGDN